MTKELDPETTIPPALSRAVSPVEVSGVLEEHGCQKADEVWFFDSRLVRNTPSIYSTLVSAASRRVWVWDRYLNDGDIDLFQRVQSGVSFRLLFEASPQSEKDRRNANNFIAAFTALNPAVTLQVAYLNRDEWKDPAFAFHDRYLFVDDDVFSIGSSLTSHRKRECTTAVIGIHGATARELLRNRFDSYWYGESTKRINWS